MSIVIKSKHEINKIREASFLAGKVLEMIEPYIKEGVSTAQIDSICHDYIVKKKALSGCLGYLGFPKSVCISINDVVCHGIPSDKRILKNKDIVNVDITVVKNGYYGDTSKMFIVGESTSLGKRLCSVAQKSLYIALQTIKPGVSFQNIGMAIENFISSTKFSIVKEYCGHGTGCMFHEEPLILHYNSKIGNEYTLKSGMIFTVEPMINAGYDKVKIMKDGWTVKTADSSLSAQYEHTVLVTDMGCEILTIRKEEKIPKYILNR